MVAFPLLGKKNNNNSNYSHYVSYVHGVTNVQHLEKEKEKEQPSKKDPKSNYTLMLAIDPGFRKPPTRTVSADNPYRDKDTIVQNDEKDALNNSSGSDLSWIPKKPELISDARKDILQTPRKNSNSPRNNNEQNRIERRGSNCDSPRDNRDSLTNPSQKKTGKIEVKKVLKMKMLQ